MPKINYQVKQARCRTVCVSCSHFSLKSKQMCAWGVGGLYTKMFTVVSSGW